MPFKMMKLMTEQYFLLEEKYRMMNIASVCRTTSLFVTAHQFLLKKALLFILDNFY